VIYAGIGQGGVPVVVTPSVPLPRPPAEEQPSAKDRRPSKEPGAHRPERVQS
jgi:hypothetical protein